MGSKHILIAIKASLVIALAMLTTATHAVAQETVLYNFPCGASGCEPGSNLIFDAAGNLYGTSPYGGAFSYGVVFELSPQAGGGWTEQVLHSFNTGIHDGNEPQGGLIFDAAGNLYGTTPKGGEHAGGIVFELTPASGGGWTEYVLHNFGAGTDWSEPYSALIMDAAGNLYGTTNMGGAHGDGTAFELSPVTGGGWTEKILHSFSGTTDGSRPYAGLTFDAAGNLYGTATNGGAYNGGTVFELTPQSGGQWAGKVLHAFGEVNANGVSTYEPYGGVTFDAAGDHARTGRRIRLIHASSRDEQPRRRNSRTPKDDSMAVTLPMRAPTRAPPPPATGRGASEASVQPVSAGPSLRTSLTPPRAPRSPARSSPDAT